ncbi:MAG: hypothetical protein KA536_11570 [Saprospiraceae bacterium]|nr:hypothetical protein [Saprospiraceae bacterium]
MTTPIKIYIDPTLPHVHYLQNKLPYEQVNDDAADIKLLYAHDTSMRLEPLDKYNTRASKGVKEKVLFFSWYNFNAGDLYYNHVFSPYVGPGKMHLWSANVKFIQMPHKIEDILINIQKLTHHA